MKPHPGNSLLTRPSLLRRVRDPRDGESWDEFHRLYRRLVHARAVRAGLAHADAEEVVQDVFGRVAETIGDFEHDPKRGSFRGWLMQLTQWRIADKFRQLRRGPGAPEVGTAAIEQLPAPAAEAEEWEREWQAQIFAAALEHVAPRVQPQHFQVFDLYSRQGWPVLKVSAQFGLNPASVYLVSHRVTKLVKAEVARLRARLD